MNADLSGGINKDRMSGFNTQNVEVFFPLCGSLTCFNWSTGFIGPSSFWSLSVCQNTNYERSRYSFCCLISSLQIALLSFLFWNPPFHCCFISCHCQICAWHVRLWFPWERRDCVLRRKEIGLGKNWKMWPGCTVRNDSWLCLSGCLTCMERMCSHSKVSIRPRVPMSTLIQPCKLQNHLKESW